MSLCLLGSWWEALQLRGGVWKRQPQSSLLPQVEAGASAAACRQAVRGIWERLHTQSEELAPALNLRLQVEASCSVYKGCEHWKVDNLQPTARGIQTLGEGGRLFHLSRVLIAFQWTGVCYSPKERLSAAEGKETPSTLKLSQKLNLKVEKEDTKKETWKAHSSAFSGVKNRGCLVLHEMSHQNSKVEHPS